MGSVSFLRRAKDQQENEAGLGPEPWGAKGPSLNPAQDVSGSDLVPNEINY